MAFAQFYFQRFIAFEKFIEEQPNPNLGICIVIPCYNEPDICTTLKSLWNCHRPNCAIEIIIAINSPENTAKEILAQNRKTQIEINEFAENHQSKSFKIYTTFSENLPKKHAGAGLARKIGMDEALRRFDAIENPHGIIVGLDADTTCNEIYLTEIERHFSKNPDCVGASLNFEHPIYGDNFAEEYYQSIALYELHLRYVNQAWKYTNFPNSYHTIGSAFAVRADEYMLQGGMNKRNAGEDFYFLHKIIASGKYANIPTATVYPSPRQSLRAPFGTGATITKMIQDNKFEYQTYDFEIFEILKYLFENVASLYKSNNYKEILRNDLLINFLEINKFESAIIEIKNNSASIDKFIKRFYRWFDAFRIVKFMNYCSEKAFPRKDVIQMANLLRNKILHKNEIIENPKKLLEWYREFEISNNKTK